MIAVDLRREIRDRFGPIPAPVELLLEVGSLKILAAQREVTAIESKGDKLMITRHNDYVMIEDKFPRLTRREPKARLEEIKRLLKSL